MKGTGLLPMNGRRKKLSGEAGQFERWRQSKASDAATDAGVAPGRCENALREQPVISTILATT